MALLFSPDVRNSAGLGSSASRSGDRDRVVTNTLTGNTELVGPLGETNRRPMTRSFAGVNVRLFERPARPSGFVRILFQITTATAPASKAASVTHCCHCRALPPKAESLVRKTGKAAHKRATRRLSGIRLDWSGNRTGNTESRAARFYAGERLLRVFSLCGSHWQAGQTSQSRGNRR